MRWFRVHAQWCSWSRLRLQRPCTTVCVPAQAELVPDGTSCISPFTSELGHQRALRAIARLCASTAQYQSLALQSKCKGQGGGRCPPSSKCTTAYNSAACALSATPHLWPARPTDRVAMVKAHTASAMQCHANSTHAHALTMAENVAGTLLARLSLPVSLPVNLSTEKSARSHDPRHPNTSQATHPAHMNRMMTCLQCQPVSPIVKPPQTASYTQRRCFQLCSPLHSSHRPMHRSQSGVLPCGLLTCSAGTLCCSTHLRLPQQAPSAMHRGCSGILSCGTRLCLSQQAHSPERQRRGSHRSVHTAVHTCAQLFPNNLQLLRHQPPDLSTACRAMSSARARGMV